MPIISNHAYIIDLLIHTIIFYSHPVIQLHANTPFHFHKCCESNVVVLTMMTSLRSQIKSLVTFLHANAQSKSLNQPTKMFTQFTERIILSHLQRSFLRIVFLWFFHSTLQFIRCVASFWSITKLLWPAKILMRSSNYCPSHHANVNVAYVTIISCIWTSTTYVFWDVNVITNFFVYT